MSGQATLLDAARHVCPICRLAWVCFLHSVCDGDGTPARCSTCAAEARADPPPDKSMLWTPLGPAAALQLASDKLHYPIIRGGRGGGKSEYQSMLIACRKLDQ